MKARFIAFEGIDFSGKTTQIMRLSRYFDAQGIKYVSTREPGGTELGRQIRQIILSDVQKLDKRTEFFLFNADRVEHIERVIRPAISDGKIVICDRFVASTFVYQGILNEMSKSVIECIHNEVCGGIYPDLTIILDVSPEEAMRRKRQDHLRLNNHYDNLELDRVAKIRNAFLNIAKSDKFKCEVINTELGEDAVFERVKELLLLQ